MTSLAQYVELYARSRQGPVEASVSLADPSLLPGNADPTYTSYVRFYALRLR